jgi:hypothetical protein
MRLDGRKEGVFGAFLAYQYHCSFETRDDRARHPLSDYIG